LSFAIINIYEKIVHYRNVGLISVSIGHLNVTHSFDKKQEINTCNKIV